MAPAGLFASGKYAKEGNRQHHNPNPPQVFTQQRKYGSRKACGHAAGTGRDGFKSHKILIGIIDEILHQIQHRHQDSQSKGYPFLGLSRQEADQQTHQAAQSQCEAGNGGDPTKHRAVHNPKMQHQFMEHRCPH